MLKSVDIPDPATADETQSNPAADPTRREGIYALRGCLRDGGPVSVAAVDMVPFSLGRKPDNSLTIGDATVSSHHAVIERLGDDLVVLDLDSTNGTFVNGKRVVEQLRLSKGDLLQLGGTVLQVTVKDEQMTMATRNSDVCDNALAVVQFGRIMERRELQMHFQPIIDVETSQRIGYEALVRSRYAGLRQADSLFQAATQLNSETALSRMARMEAMRAAAILPDQMVMFLNTHPNEISDGDLIPSLRQLRERWPDRPVVLEIHEAAITDMEQLQNLKYELTDLNMGLAFDDFGAGQSRLCELVEVRPDYVKFDIRMLDGIDDETHPQARLTKTLVKVSLDLGTIPLAEGVESQAHHEFCQDAGFKLAQGYFFGHPMPARHWMNEEACPSAPREGEQDDRS